MVISRSIYINGIKILMIFYEITTYLPIVCSTKSALLLRGGLG